MAATERIIFNRLGLGDRIPRVPQKALAELPRAGKTNPSLPEDYLCFLNAADAYLSSRRTESIDFAVFLRVLMRDAASPAVHSLVAALLRDPMQYGKGAKSKALLLLILAYIAYKRSGLDVRPLRRKIEEHEHLFEPLCELDLEWESDPFIDRFVIHLRRATSDLDEALFLNRMYVSRPACKDAFGVFHRRLCTVLEALPEPFIFSFLQHVFTHSTVIFPCITETQLWKLVISYYASENRKEQLADMLATLAARIDDCEQHAMLAEHFKSLGLSGVRHRRQQMRFEIQQFRLISEYKGFFLANRDSYAALSLGIAELASLYRRIAGPIGREYEVLEVLLGLFSDIKTEFFAQLARQYNLLLADVIDGLDAASPLFLELNRLYWGTLSNVVLATQRLGAAEPNGKKKKLRPAIRLSEAAKSAHRLVDAVVRAEKRALRAGLAGVAVLKKRGFKIS